MDNQGSIHSSEMTAFKEESLASSHNCAERYCKSSSSPRTSLLTVKEACEVFLIWCGRTCEQCVFECAPKSTCILIWMLRNPLCFYKLPLFLYALLVNQNMAGSPAWAHGPSVLTISTLLFLSPYVHGQRLAQLPDWGPLFVVTTVAVHSTLHRTAILSWSNGLESFLLSSSML